MKKTIFVMLFLFALPVAFGVAVAPTTGVQYCENFDGTPFENGNWYYGNTDLSNDLQSDGNGGKALGFMPVPNDDNIQTTAFIFQDFAPDTQNTRTIAWRWLVNTSEPPGNCGNTTADQSHHGVRAFSFGSGDSPYFVSTWNMSEELRMEIDSDYRIQSFLIDNNIVLWSLSTPPVSAGWHTFVLRMGTGGAKLYIDGILEGASTGLNISGVPHINSFPDGYRVIGVGTNPVEGGGINDYWVRYQQGNRCQYTMDDFIFDSAQWDSQRISEYTESNIASQGFTCTGSALTGDITNPNIVVQNYTQPAGISNFTFDVTDNAELGNATINCDEYSETFQLIGFNRTLGANFDAIITQTCAVDVFDSSGNTASNSFIITIEGETTSPPTLVGEPFDFVSAIANFTAEVLIALIIFAILVYPFWKMAKNK